MTNEFYKAPTIVFGYCGTKIPAKFTEYYNILTKCELNDNENTKKYSFNNSYMLNINIQFMNMNSDEFNNALNNIDNDKEVFIVLYLNIEFYKLFIDYDNDVNSHSAVNNISSYFFDDEFNDKRVLVLKDDDLSYEMNCENFNKFLQFDVYNKKSSIACIPILRKYNEFLNSAKDNKENAKFSTFISYRQSNREIVDKVNRVIMENKIDNYVDIYKADNNIQISIKNAIKKSDGLLVIYTDDYAVSPWCVFEIDLARELNKPITLLNAVEFSESRILQYTSNLKSVKFNPKGKHSLATISDSLVVLLFQSLVKQLMHMETMYLLTSDKKSLTERISSIHFQPSLIDVSMNSVFSGDGKIETPEVVLYPEPKIISTEKKRLEDAIEQYYKEQTKILTLLEYQILKLGGNKNGVNKVIQLSCSNSNDLSTDNIIYQQIEDFLKVISRYIYESNCQISYAGSFSQNYHPNISKILIDHAALYNFEAKSSDDKNVTSNLLLFYDDGFIDGNKRNNVMRISEINEKINNRVSFLKKVKISFNYDLCEEHISLEDRKMINLLSKEDSMHKMREEFEKESNCLLMVGGKTYKDLNSGMVQELLLYLGKKPLFIIPDFGGSSKVIATLLLKLYLSKDTYSYEQKICKLEKMLEPVVSSIQSKFLDGSIHHKKYIIDSFKSILFDENNMLVPLEELMCNGLSKDENLQLLKNDYSAIDKIQIIIKGLYNAK